MNFEVKRSEESVKIYGTEYPIKRPTVESVESLQAAVEKAEEEDDKKSGFQISREWIVSLGIPMDVINGMEMQHFADLMGFFTSNDKKK